jgi:branched-subunit amino acid aminotransferase/4-amino-4-deoxychorismate lyase
VAAADLLVATDEAWVPSEGEKSLYLRPFMFASEAFLGVRSAAKVTFCLIASPVGPYFPSGLKPVSIWLSEEYTRAAPGGTGAPSAPATTPPAWSRSRRPRPTAATRRRSSTRSSAAGSRSSAA